ncbi:MAG: metal-dependent hydrolase, partial [Candidatus Eisenbacteria bacterium]|nr:metal-dependent hydrolase [Candidatus Eisenbacteria bacterium]
MDPLTHVIAGVVAGGLLEADAAGFATAAVAAMAPDAEFVTRRIPRTAFLDYHHGVVHSIPGGILAGFVIAMGAGAILGRGWESMLPFALAGVGSHIALDLLMHNNGIALFAPFSRRRYSFPVVLGLNHLTSSRTCRDQKYGTCIACQARGLRYNPFFWVLLIAALACLAVPALSRAWAILALSVLVGLSFNATSYRSVALGVAGNAPHALRVKAFPASHSMSRWLVLREEPEETRATLVEARGPRVLWARSVPKQIPPPPV